MSRGGKAGAFALVGLIALFAGPVRCSASAEPMSDLAAKIQKLVTAELASMGCASAHDLVPGAPARALVPGEVMTVPYSGGRSFLVVAALAPTELPVPTELEYLRFAVRLDTAGQLVVTARPARADLAAAVAQALGAEGNAVASAAEALTRAGLHPPPERKSWPRALKRVTYDSRLPAVEFGSAPTSWSLIFEPRGPQGWNQVLLDGSGRRVTAVNGKPM